VKVKVVNHYRKKRIMKGLIALEVKQMSFESGKQSWRQLAQSFELDFP